MTVPAPPAGSEVSGRVDILRDFLGRRFNRLNPDLFGQFGTDAETRLADLANDIGMPTEKANTLLLAKAHFAEANRDLRGAGKLFDPDRHASTNAAQLNQVSRIARFLAIIDLATHEESKLG